MAKLLIIDDDVTLRGLFEKAFTNFEVLFADTIDKAIEVFKEDKPEVVIIDRYLSGEEGGIQMVEEGEVGDASCILLTASNVTPDFRAEMLGLGFLYVLEKPFSVTEMRAVVNRALSHWATKKCCTTNFKAKTSILSFEQSALDKLRNAAAAFKMAVGG